MTIRPDPKKLSRILPGIPRALGKELNEGRSIFSEEQRRHLKEFCKQITKETPESILETIEPIGFDEYTPEWERWDFAIRVVADLVREEEAWEGRECPATGRMLTPEEAKERHLRIVRREGWSSYKTFEFKQWCESLSEGWWPIFGEELQ